MAGTYDGALATAQKLIAKFGQTILVRRSVAGAAADPAKPWRPGAPKLTVFSVTGVVLDKENRATGQISERVLLAAKGLSFVPAMTDVLRVGGLDRGIANLKPLNPGGTTILYEIELAAPALLTKA